MITSPMNDECERRRRLHVTGSSRGSRGLGYQYALTSSHVSAFEKSISTSRLRLESTETSCELGSISSSLSIPISKRTCSVQPIVSIPLVTNSRPSPSEEVVSLRTSVLFASSAEGPVLGRAQVPVGGDARISANRRVRAASVAASSSG